MIGIFTRKCKKELSKNKVDNINWNEINMVKRMLGYFNTNVLFRQQINNNIVGFLSRATVIIHKYFFETYIIYFIERLIIHY